MATHSSILAWKSSGTEEPGVPQSTGSQKRWTRLSNGTTAGVFLGWASLGAKMRIVPGKLRQVGHCSQDQDQILFPKPRSKAKSISKGRNK